MLNDRPEIDSVLREVLSFVSAREVKLGMRAHLASELGQLETDETVGVLPVGQREIVGHFDDIDAVGEVALSAHILLESSTSRTTAIHFSGPM